MTSFPFPFIEVEDQDDGSVLVNCSYGKFEEAIKQTTKDKKLPLIFVGVTEKWTGLLGKQNMPIFSRGILEAVWENLYKKSGFKQPPLTTSSLDLTPSDQTKARIWLWKPPIETTFGYNGEKIYVCLLCYISNHSNKFNKVYMAEFVAKSLLLTLCSRLGDVTTTTEETSLLDCARYLTGSAFLQGFPNMNCKNIFHVLPLEKPPTIVLELECIFRKQIGLFDEMGTQFNINELILDLSSLWDASKVEILLKRNTNKQILTPDNVIKLIEGIVSAANQHLIPEELPTTLKSFLSEKDDVESNHTLCTKNDGTEPMDWSPTPHVPVRKSVVSREELINQENNHFAHSPRMYHNSGLAKPRSEQHDTKPSKDVKSDNLQTSEILQLYASKALGKLDALTVISESGVNQILKDAKGSYDTAYDGVDISMAEQHVNTLANCITEYILIMHTQFKKKGYFLDENLNKVHTDVVSQILDNIKISPELIKPYAKQAFVKLYQLIFEDNKIIRNHHKQTVFQSKPQVINMYAEELKRFRSEKGPFQPKLFQKLGATLFTQCINAFKKATEHNGQPLKDFPQLESELDDLARQLKLEADRQSVENETELRQEATKNKNDQIRKQAYETPPLYPTLGEPSTPYSMSKK